MSEKISSFFLPYMPHIANYQSEFNSLNRLLGKTTLTGKISSLSIAENLFIYMEETKVKFNDLQSRLIDVLVEENVNKTYNEITALAQVTIDILIRNLFERTADVGFLATDSDIRAFLSKDSNDEEEQKFMLNRLREYVAKYSVYDEIILFDAEGKARFNLDQNNKIAGVNDPLVEETLNTDKDYIETFRHSPLQKERETSLIYSAPINNHQGDKVIGVLCLCFKVKDEMDRIFDSLTKDHPDAVLALLDSNQNIITHSRSKALSSVNKVPVLERTQLFSIKSATYITTVTDTNGYQGYFGAGWRGAGLVNTKVFSHHSNNADHDKADYIHEESALMDKTLHDIIEESENLLEDLGDVVINGEIIASKKRSYELNPVLDNVRSISNNINDISVNSIKDLLSTVLMSYMENIKFYATVAVDIMDRNLYERANDCRWWALTGDFRRILGQKEITGGDVETLEGILAYINDLYTVYTNLFLFDKNGQIIAVSKPGEHNIIGERIADNIKSKVLANNNTQRYFVSDFEKTRYYKDRHTYIYYASILSMEGSPSPIGGIGIVFDSEPEFHAMLADSLPRDENNTVLEHTYALFIDSHGNIISSTTEKYSVGDLFEVDSSLLKASEEKGVSKIIEKDDKTYLVGCKQTFGYREYKTSDNYDNDIFALMIMEI